MASEAVVAVELGREIGSSVGSGAATASLPSSMATLIGGRIEADNRVGIGAIVAIGAIGARLSALAAAIRDAVVVVCLENSPRLDQNLVVCFCDVARPTKRCRYARLRPVYVLSKSRIFCADT